MEVSRTSVAPVAATGTIEWAPFMLVDGVDEATLLVASEALQREFLSQQPGFVRRELLRGTGNQWVDLVYWASQEAAEAAMQNVASSSVCHRYFALMAGADAGEPGAGVLHLAQVAQY
jgi:hypothetical protein